MALQQVVVVEDDHDTLTMLGDLLTNEGYRVIPCARGELAYEIIRRAAPDLAIVDLMLGGPEEGWLILTLLRSDPVTAQLPIILCSANVQFLRQRSHVLRQRGCAALEKPFGRDDLVGAIVEACGLQQAGEAGV